MTSLGYGTASTSLSVDECKEIQKPPVNAVLPKMGINRNTKREVVFGTTKCRGLGLTHLAAVQGYLKLQYILRNLRSDDTSGTLYQILMEFTQLECGMEQEILSCDFDKYEKNILTPNWITECWRSLKLCDATI
jgi:folate-dependent tRNA-U54 methylase TrmFO/GidA